MLWLSVKQHIELKIVLTVFKTINGEVPQCLPVISNSDCTTCSCDTDLLKSCGDCAFCLAGPALENRLPEETRKAAYSDEVKSVFNTHLLKVAFNANQIGVFPELCSFNYRVFFLNIYKEAVYLRSSIANNVSRSWT